MNLPTAILTIRWMTWDTFRQARASGILWLMLGISVLCTIFCVSASVHGDRPLQNPDGPTEFLPRGDPAASNPAKLNRQGVEVVHGELRLAFGAVRLPQGRDAEDTVRFLHVILAGGVADALDLLLCLTWTAGFLPMFLEPGAAGVLLAKPVPRWWLLAGKYFGVLMFVGFQGLVFVGGTWAALGVATGLWLPEYLMCIPLLVLHFAVMYSVSALLAVCTRSTVACVFGSILFWLLCWGLNYGRHMLVAMPALNAETTPFPAAFLSLVDVLYWILPKPADFSMLLQSALHAADHFGAVPVFDAVQQSGAFHAELSLVSSFAFAVVMLAAAARQLATTDY
ncbi:MAG TPA: hypothetical protein VG099_02190 [Gemmataceae bacterium]|nr:hypothetical protein [Gemmataceae bacterium]